MDNIFSIEILLHGSDKKADLILSQNGQNIDTLIVPLDIHLDTLLVTSIDKILKRNRIDVSHLNIATVGGDIDKSSVAYGIATAVTEAIKSK